MLAAVFFIHTDERAFRRGAEGEEVVARKLAKLDDRWRVLHSVPVGAGDCDIDHVVIGPSGVFCLNTKHHGGKEVWVHTNSFKVDGVSQDYLRKSRAEGARCSRLLAAACAFDVVVQPAIVVISDEIVRKGEPEGVIVSSPRRVAKRLMQRPQSLDVATVDLIYEQARRSTTWR